VSAPPPASFAAFLRAKRGWMAFLFAWTTLGGMVLPLFLASYYDAYLFGTPEERLIAAWAPLAAVSRVTGLGLLGILQWLPVAVAMFGLLVQVAIEAVIWWTRLDRADHAWTSFTWTIRSWPAGLAWTLLGLGLFVVVFHILDRAQSSFAPWMLAALAVPAAWLLMAPFFAGNPANLARDVPSLRWRPRWPGAFAVVIAIGALVAMAAIDYGLGQGLDRVPLEGSAKTAIEGAAFLLSAFVGLALLAYVGFSWLNRRGGWLGVDDRRIAWSRTSLAALAASWLRPLGWLTAAFPVLALLALQIFIWPQVEETLRKGSGPYGLFPSRWQALMEAVRFAKDILWLVVPWPAIWIASVHPGRLFVQLGFVRPHP
jgi:hypothetical protein